VTGDRRRVVGLALLFGAIYFIQGIAEPTEGLVAQPVRSLLKSWGRGAFAIAAFTALLASPWFFKPLYGLLTDLVPLAGSRRRNYLIAGGIVAALGFGIVGLAPPAGAGRLLLWLLVPTLAIAFTDVVADALMIEVGRPLGLAGRLQAVQWGSMSAAALVAGTLGGRLSEAGRQRTAFLICGVLAAASVVLAVAFVRDPPSAARPGMAPGAIRRAARSPTLRGVAGFLFLWNFNPFSNAVLYLHATRGLGLGERAWGDIATAFAAACLAASLAYGTYCRRVPMPLLVRASIPLGVASNLAYWWLADARTALPVTLAAGFLYQTATLIQLDLAARACPPAAAGTVFATLMALENLAASSSTALGGYWYERWALAWGDRAAFNGLVGVGATFTAACWLLLPLTDRAGGGPTTGDEAAG